MDISSTLDNLLDALRSVSSLSIPAAVSLFALALLLILFAALHRRARIKKDLENAENDYRLAIASRDLDRIRVAVRRLRDAQRKAGIKPPA